MKQIEMKILLSLIVSIITLTDITAQVGLLSNIEIQETDLAYKDSINGQITFGDYEPTGIVSLNDGSLIISTKFSISFPEQYQMPDSFSNAYFERQKIFEEKSHSSSGSIFMLNGDFEKQWEIFFKERRVEKIKKLSDESIIAVGESVDMKFFWVAKINRQGAIIFDKSYKFKRSPDIQNFEIDSLNNLYILLATEKIQPRKVTKHYGKKRISFFKETDMESDIYLLKLTPSGRIKWKTVIDKRKNYSAFGYDLIIEKDIYLSTSYEGFIKEKKEWHKEEGKNIYQLNKKGNILNTYQAENKGVYILGGKLIFSTNADNDTLCLYQKDKSEIKLIKTIVFNKRETQFWTEKTLSTENNNYILGTNNNNLGCIVIEFDKKNICTGYWKYDNSSFVDATIGSDNSIVLIAENYSNLNLNSNNEKKYSIKLIIIKKNGS